VSANLETTPQECVVNSAAPANTAAKSDCYAGAVNNQAGGSDQGNIHEASTSEMDCNPAAENDGKRTASDAEEWPQRSTCCLKRRRQRQAQT